jgi:flagellar protein FlaG
MSEVTRTEARLFPVATVLAPSSAGSMDVGGKTLPPQVPDVAAQPEVVVPEAEIKPDVNADISKRVQAAVAQMNEYIQSTQRDLHFSYDPEAGETVIKVLDRVTQDVIRQIPDEIFLKLAQGFDSEGNLHLLSAQA